MLNANGKTRPIKQTEVGERARMSLHAVCISFE
jgi:hypothetical protein